MRILSLYVLLVLPVWSHAQDEVLYGLDAGTSQVFRFDPVAGETEVLFATPVLCRPEGACGLAFSGYSFFFMDATDPDRQILELNPRDGTIWNSLSAPAGGIDGLAFADGVLYAASFLEDRIYKLDPVSGEVLDAFGVDADLIGGLAAGAGRIYASRIRPGQLFEIDAVDGSVVRTLDSPGDLPAGLAYAAGKLYVGDPELRRIFRLDGDTGSAEAEWAPALDGVAGLASGAGAVESPYQLRLEIVEELLQADGSVVYELRTGLYDDAGDLVSSNNRSTIAHVLNEDKGLFLGASNPLLDGGETTVRLELPTGVRLLLEARLSGLAPAQISLGVISPTERMIVTLGRDAADETLVEVVAELFDSFGLVAASDSNDVFFRVAYGGGVLVGPERVRPEAGMAQTWVRLTREKTDLVVEAQTREVRQKGKLQVGVADLGPIAHTGGLTVSAQRVAGRDELPPAPPGNVQAELVGGIVEITWELSPDEGELRWIPYAGHMTRRYPVTGYRIYQSRDGGIFEEIGWVPDGMDQFSWMVDGEPATYRYKVVSEETENLGEEIIIPDSVEDVRRTVAVGGVVGRDVEGNPVTGLFDDDLTVGFSDFFLFTDHFGQDPAGEDFDAKFDLDGDGMVGFGDFFIFADNFGKVAVSR